MWKINNKLFNKVIVFSRIFEADSADWVDIYDWCNAEFVAIDWNFWYDVIDRHHIQGHFEFSQEDNAIQFQLRWG